MPEEQIQVLANARRNRRTIVIDDIIPEIVQMNLNLEQEEPQNKEKNTHEGTNLDKTTDLEQLAGSTFLDQFSNKKPEPYTSPLQKTQKIKQEFLEKSIFKGKEMTGHQKLESQHEKPSKPPSFADSKL